MIYPRRPGAAQRGDGEPVEHEHPSRGLVIVIVFIIIVIITMIVTQIIMIVMVILVIVIVTIIVVICRTRASIWRTYHVM